MTALVQSDIRAFNQPATPIDTECLRAGAGEPLLLLHGVTGSAAMWRRVMPLLAPHQDVIAFTALGHRGGPRASERPARIAHIVDDVERRIDALGFERLHLAGNSMGGWVALELARRGRASSVCALSPAGLWHGRDSKAVGVLRSVVRRARAARPFMPLLTRLPAVRSIALRESACHGERVTRRELLDLIDDLLGCTVCEDLFDTPEQLAPLSASCPITIAWAGEDRVFPRAEYDKRVRELVPDAQYVVLEGLGHVAMLDDPRRVADTILAAIARTKH